MIFVHYSSLFLNGLVRHGGGMLLIHCPECARRELVSLRRIRTIHNTPRGPMGDVCCPRGHALLYDFRRGATISVGALTG